MFIHVSRLIPKPVSHARKNCLEGDNHKSRINKNLNHVSREKNGPDHVSQKKYRGPSLIGRSGSEHYLIFELFNV